MKAVVFFSSLTLLSIFLFLAVPTLALVQGPPQPPAGGSTFKNPLGDNVTLTGFLIRITNWLLGISAFLVMVALIVGGIRFVISFGNEQAVSSAKRILTWAVIGLIIITLSYAILTFVRQILGVT